MQVITGPAEVLPNNLYAKVVGYRHQVFVEQLGWALHTENGMESDQFDRADTVYVVAQDDNGHISGCARLLPT
ncbi:MAG: acyl-homoserine-lactone synthase, partial [Acidithiobacillus ferrooxidans]